MSKITRLLRRTRAGVFRRGAGTPTLADHIDTATTLVQGSSRGDLGHMPTAYGDEDDSGNPYDDASKIAPWNSKTN